MRTRTAIATLVVAVAVAACGGDSGDGADRGAVDAPATVVVIGDSLLLEAADELDPALRAAGWEPFLEGRYGASIRSGSGIPSWPDRLREMVAAHDPDAVVIELGTNDCADCGALDDDVAALIDAAGDTPSIVWLGVRSDGAIPSDPGAVNEAIRAGADADERVRFVPLDDAFADAPRLVVDDGVHMTDAGQQVLAEVIVDALPEVRGRP